MKEIKQMNRAQEWENSPRNPNRFYSVYGLAPALNTCQGGGRAPKVLEIYEDCDLSDRRKLAEANADL
jgi:hypothetical protein